MANTTKQMSKQDSPQVLKGSYNEVNASLSVDGYLTAKVGRKVEMAIATTSIANDTEVYTFSESGIDLYEITIIYTDGSREIMISAERTA